MKKRYSIIAAGMFLCLMLSGLAVPARAANDETLVEAFGALSGLALYNTHVVIGMAADAYVKEVYTADETKGMIGEQQNALKLIKEYNDKLLASSSLADADKASLRDINATIGKIQGMMYAFEDYLDNESTENANAFDAARQASYAAIADLLGLKKD